MNKNKKSSFAKKIKNLKYQKTIMEDKTDGKNSTEEEQILNNCKLILKLLGTWQISFKAK